MGEVWDEDLIKMFKLVLASLERSVKDIGVLRDDIRGVNGRVDELYRVVQEVGETRIKDCNYSRDGYCNHIFYAMPGRPDDKKKNTVKIDDKYYPTVDWLMCYLCGKYAVFQEETASD